MRFRSGLLWFGAVLALVVSAYGLGREFRVYQSMELYDDVPLPPDYDEKTELVLGRLMYPPHPYGFLAFGRNRGDWRSGGTTWTVDYPRGDRHFAEILRRLTRVHVRSAEQPVNLEDGDDVYDYPWLYVNLPGSMKLTEAMAAKLRDYLLRGGFLMVDNFFGTPEWEIFQENLDLIFPDRKWAEMSDDEQIFHTVFDTSKRFQIAGQWALRRGTTYRNDGSTDYWRAVNDDQGRIMMMISFNSDMGDSWEWADSPNYPEHYSALGMRLGINYVVYAMTH